MRNGFSPSKAQMLMSEPENELFFSVSSLWERLTLYRDAAPHSTLPMLRMELGCAADWN
jgi:hypothetical protein